MVERAKGRMLLLLSNKVPGYRVIKWSSERLQDWPTNIQPSVHLVERAQVNLEPIEKKRKTPAKRCILHTHTHTQVKQISIYFHAPKIIHTLFNVIIFGHGFFLTVKSEQEKKMQKFSRKKKEIRQAVETNHFQPLPQSRSFTDEINHVEISYARITTARPP